MQSLFVLACKNSHINNRLYVVIISNRIYSFFIFIENGSDCVITIFFFIVIIIAIIIAIFNAIIIIIII